MNTSVQEPGAVPPEIRKLFESYAQDLVFDALREAGIAVNFSLLTQDEIEQGAAKAVVILERMKVHAQELIDEAPDGIRRLFREYDPHLVRQVLNAVGINVDPATLTDQEMLDGVTQAEILIRAELSHRLNKMLDAK